MRQERQARFITLEGIEGLGKTTNLELVRDTILASGAAVEITREPGGTAMAERIRELVLDPGDEPVTDFAELLLMFAARSQHVENRIRPALAAGRWVLCDRFTDATLAYQGYGRGLRLDAIRKLASWVHGGLWPDLTILLDADVSVSEQRRQGRGGADRIERERHAFFQRVREGYLELARREPERIAVIDATGPLDTVQAQIRRLLADRFGFLT